VHAVELFKLHGVDDAVLAARGLRNTDQRGALTILRSHLSKRRLQDILLMCCQSSVAAVCSNRRSQFLQQAAMTMC
jgi:hypothetical protein